MNRLCSFRALLIAIPLIWFQLSTASPNRPFRWADDENYRPLIYRDASGHPAGIFNDLMSELFRRLNVPLECRLYPWRRAQKLVREGRADGMITILTEERKKFLEASKPLITVNERVFTSRRNPRLQQILAVKSLDDLRKFTLVETSGSGWSKEHLEGMKVIWVTTAASALNMIATGRADIYLMGYYTGPEFLRMQIRRNGPLSDRLREIVMGPHPLAEVDYRLLIRKDSPYVDLVDRIDRTLQQMKEDGSYRTIVQRYEAHENASKNSTCPYWTRKSGHFRSPK